MNYKSDSETITKLKHKKGVGVRFCHDLDEIHTQNISISSAPFSCEAPATMAIIFHVTVEVNGLKKWQFFREIISWYACGKIEAT